MTEYAPASPRESSYDCFYQTDNYFRHRERLYRPFVRSLIALTGLTPGQELLDAGCGQGFFAHLFAQEGITVYATDASIVGLRAAKRRQVPGAARFFASDLLNPCTSRSFDAVFVRSCSLYNTGQPELWRTATAALVSMVKPGGQLIFVYNTNLSGRVNGWRHHRLEDLQALLAASCAPLDVYFINRLDAMVLRRLAFTGLVTSINKFFARKTGLGGEAVAIFRVPRRR